jgi:hypothetical protein
MFRFKIIIVLLAFSLGIASVLLIGGYFSYFASMFERKTEIQEVAAQSIEVLSEPVSNENKTGTVQKEEYPFKDHSVAEIYKGKNAPLKLSREENRLYGEKLQYTIENYGEVEFAGHYIVAIWSCGMWCEWSAFIDAKTGKVYWWNGILSYCFPHLDSDFACNEDFSSVEYRIDSKLIVFFGYRNGEDGSRGFHYYKFENGRFIHLKSILVKELRSQSQLLLDEAGKKRDNEDP